MAKSPRKVIHRMQLLLNIMNVYGVQNHMEFGKNKCKLMITARPGKLRAVEELLKTEPGILTFYGLPIKQVDDFNIHIGVPQQSKQSVDYRISKTSHTSSKLPPKTVSVV